MIRWVHPHAGEGCGLRPASDEGTGPKRSEETGDEERQRLNRTTRTNAASRINRGTSEEVNGRSEATEPGTTSDRVPMEPLRSHSPGQPHRQRRSSWSERSDVTRNEERSPGQQKRTRRGSPRRRGPVASAVGCPAGKNLHQVDNLIRKGMQ